MYFHISLLLLCSAVVFAAPSDYTVKETHEVPDGWTEIRDAPKSDIIRLQIGLKASNENALEQHLLDISDPAHHRYKQYLNYNEIATLVAPTNETQDLVETWLLEHGHWSFTYHEPARDWILLDLSIGEAEELLQTRYSEFRHHESSTVVRRTTEFSLPRHLHGHIDVVQPTTSFFGAASHNRQSIVTGVEERSNAVEILNADSSVSKACKKEVTPTCVRTLYGSIDYEPQVPGQNKIGITNFLNQSSHRGDIKKYLKLYRPEAVSAADDFKIVIINDAANMQGPYNFSDPESFIQNAEGDLDAETDLGLTWPTPLIAYNTGGYDVIHDPWVIQVVADRDYHELRLYQKDGLESEPFLAWLMYMRTQKDIPQVISISYGDGEDKYPKSYQRKVCKGFAELGARGVSILASSGDTAVAGRDGKCNGKKFVPHFPASCPWVTAVGGTAGYEPEHAWMSSGGGFSSMFAMPDYQKSTVNGYIKSLNGLYKHRYNQAGRGYPDVSAQSEELSLVQGGTNYGVSGTSGAAPIFASHISLVNDALLAQGKPPLGFLNPWLYQAGHEALTDILSQPGAEGNPACRTKGFPVQEGWDAVTGLGTPNFQKLLDTALAR